MEINEKIDNILSQQHDILLNFESILNNMRTLRNLCARGSDIQLLIASNKNFQQFLNNLLLTNKSSSTEEKIHKLRTVGWQTLANTIVNNEQSQMLVWQCHGDKIFQKCFDPQIPLDGNVDIMLMIIYNIMNNSSGESTLRLPLVLRAVVCIWQNILEQKCSLPFDFLHFIFEVFLVKDGRKTVKCYSQLKTNEKIAFLDYLVHYLRQESPNGLVHTFLLQHISKEFKMKSDCMLRVTTLQEIDKIKPLEAYALLRCLAIASGSEYYSQVYASDHSLFLNVSSLLRCIVKISKDSVKTIFTPMNKLEDVAPSSNIAAHYQSEISYELKTLLVRSIANLLYNNETNKGYCLDTQLMPTLLECTNMDARNPLMKEWSILAIRNACVGCPEIQQVISDLTEQGPAPNDLLTELDLDLGSLRINPGKE